jgi:predicted RNA-binding protein YlqC (UPF0109 family)
MDLVLLTKTIVSMIVSDKEAVSVREFDTTEENLIHLEVLVEENDLGKVIGRGGKTINSIRNIVQASSTLNGGKKVKIEVDSY